MLCFKDMTFCPFWKECKDGKTCDRALTGKVWDSAERWWGGDRPPVAVFAEHPDCFVEKESERV